MVDVIGGVGCCWEEGQWEEKERLHAVRSVENEDMTR